MAANFCAQCGAVRADHSAPVCPLCGAGYVAPVVVRSASAATHDAYNQQNQHQQHTELFGRAEQSSTSSVESVDMLHSTQRTAQQHPTNSSLRRAQTVPISSSTGHPRGAAQQTRGILARRYADHPLCDVCSVNFDLTRRRHQCRKCSLFVCGACSPVRLLIPWGEQMEHARGYDKSIPQRVCLHCAPALHPRQDELVTLFARANIPTADAPPSAAAHSRMLLPYTNSLEHECARAAAIVSNFFHTSNAAASDRSIPIALLERAQGLAMLTIVQAGFVVAGKVGTGLVTARLANGTWSAPSAIQTAGLSGGFQIGAEVVDVLLILGSQSAVQVFYKPQVNLGAGLDIAVGPYGRAASAAAAVSTDAAVNANYSYSHSKGLFAGIALTGSVIAARNDLNRKFYGRDLEPKALLNGSIAPPLAAQPLYVAIASAMSGVSDHNDVVATRAALMGDCRLCACTAFVAHSLQVWNKKCKSCDHVH